MTRHNFCVFTVALCVAVSVNTALCQSRLAPKPPAIDHRDQRFLCRVARRAYDAYQRDESIYKLSYVPSTLADLRCHVVVTVRDAGKLLGTGTSGRGPVVKTTVEAAIAASRDAQAAGLGPAGDRAGTSVEIEVIGEERRVEIEGDWFAPGKIERRFDAGLDGLSVRVGDTGRRVCPSEMVIKNQPVRETLTRLVKSFGRAANPANPMTLWRFRTCHWYSPAEDGDVVALRRGVVLVPANGVTEVAVNAAIDRIAKALMFRQRPSGLFAYEYEPTTNAYTKRDSAVHQAGAAWAMAEYAADSRLPAAMSSAKAAIAAHQAAVLSLPEVTGAAFVASADGKNKLGLTAQAALAMMVAPGGERYRATVATLLAGELWLQQPSGEFLTAFPPARRLTGLDVYPALALLGLAAEYEHQPDGKILDAFNRAFGHYRPRVLASNATAMSAAWLQQPFARMAVASNRRQFARFAFTLADRLVDRQLTPANCASAELRGGVVMVEGSPPDIRTAVCLRGWVDCLRAARKFGDTQRVARYELAATRAARFVMQLQVRRAETYYLRVADDVVGGVRTSLVDDRLPLENLQYALSSLIQYRSIIFEPSP